jgi:hypothetical protein
MSTNPLSPWGPFYRDAPLLQDAINHAERLSELLRITRPRPGDERGAAWLVGRIEEMEIFVELIVQRWRFESVAEADAATAITAYLDALHHGLALHFGELSLKCCCDSLFSTSIPAPSLSQTAEIPVFDANRRPNACDATVIDVDPSDLLSGFTPAPFTPTPQVC